MAIFNIPSAIVSAHSRSDLAVTSSRRFWFDSLNRSANPFQILYILVLLLLPAAAFAQVPSYSVEFMGQGYGTMNNAGVVIGNESAFSPGTPWFNDGSGLKYLPLPASATSGSVADINDTGVIVGSVDTDGDSWDDTPVKWTLDAQGTYTVETLPLPGSATKGDAIAINNHGVILAETSPFSDAYVIDNSTVTPIGLQNAFDINDNGIILTNTQIYDYTNATPLAFAPLSADMPYGELYPVSINNNNEVLVNIWTTTLSTTSYYAIGIYKIGEGWTLFMGVQTYWTGASINDNGDISMNSKHPTCDLIHLSNVSYCLADLVDAASSDWAVSDASVIANDRTILALGANSLASEFGLVRLSVAGDVAVPQTPVNFVATPHEPTLQQPFSAIDLSWDPADALTRSYTLERKRLADANFSVIASTINKFYRDTNIVGGETYQYRVTAVGVAGNSAPSAIVSALAPMPPNEVTVPDAPINFVATPNEPTMDQPASAIDLSWDPADSLTVSYILERKGPADGDFAVIVASTTNQFYRDTNIEGGNTYAYRVTAVGVAGSSTPSEVVSALAPLPAETDNVAPVITSISLQNGDVVSGNVKIAVSATDNVEVSYIHISATGLSCTVYAADAVCTWRTSKLAVGDYTVTVTASDTTGNLAGDEVITVSVAGRTSGGGKTKPGNGGGNNGKGKK